MWPFCGERWLVCRGDWTENSIMITYSKSVPSSWEATLSRLVMSFEKVFWESWFPSQLQHQVVLIPSRSIVGLQLVSFFVASRQWYCLESTVRGTDLRRVVWGDRSWWGAVVVTDIDLMVWESGGVLGVSWCGAPMLSSVETGLSCVNVVFDSSNGVISGVLLCLMSAITVWRCAVLLV